MSNSRLFWPTEEQLRRRYELMDRMMQKHGVAADAARRVDGGLALNQCCAPDSYFETMLLTRPSKNVYRQHRPIPDIRPARSSHTALRSLAAQTCFGGWRSVLASPQVRAEDTKDSI